MMQFMLVPFAEISQLFLCFFSEHVYGTPYDPYEISNLRFVSLGLILLSIFAIFKYISMASKFSLNFIYSTMDT